MTSQLLVGLGGLVLSVLTYFAGAQRAKRRYDSQARDRRIQYVADLYVKNSQASIRSGPHGLHKAGILTLRDDSECREACERIAGHGERHPLKPYCEQLKGVDLHELFRMGDEASHEYFLGHSPIELLSKMRGTSVDV